MIQNEFAAFRTSPTGIAGFQGVNFLDVPNQSNSTNWADWSNGAYLQDPLNLQPPVGAAWKVVGLSVKANLCLFGIIPGLGSSQPGSYGELGKLRASIIPKGGRETGVAIPGPVLVQNQIAEYPVILPQDTSYMFDVWDPATARTPPITNQSILAGGTAPTLLPVSAAWQATAPILVQSSVPMFIGLYIEPMLTNVVLSVWNASYTLYYDDGITPTGEIA